MNALLLIAVLYFLIKNLPKKETIEELKELKVLDGTLPQNSPLALANMGVVEDSQARVEDFLKTLSTPISSTTIPASAQGVVISSQGERIIENLKKSGIPILPISPVSIPQPGEICETIEVKNVIKMPEFSKSTAKPIVGFLQTEQSIKVYVCGSSKEERIRKANQLARSRGYTPLLV